MKYIVEWYSTTTNKWTRDCGLFTTVGTFHNINEAYRDSMRGKKEWPAVEWRVVEE